MTNYASSSGNLPMNGFTKSEKIKSKKLIDELFDNGSSFFLAPFKVVFQINSFQDKTPSKVCFTVSKRNFKRAVDRNRIKRLMRESFRLNKQLLYNHLLSKNKQVAIVFIYTGKDLPVFDATQSSIQKCLKSLITKL